MALIEFVEVDKMGAVIGYCSVNPKSIISLHDEGDSIRFIVLIETSRGSFRVKGTHCEVFKKINAALN